MKQIPEQLQEQILDYLEGKLPPDEAARVEVFLANTDPALAAQVAGMIEDRAALRRTPSLRAPADMAERIMEQVERGSLLGAAESPLAIEPRRWYHHRMAVAAGLLLAVGVFGYVVVQMTSRTGKDQWKEWASNPHPGTQVAAGDKAPGSLEGIASAPTPSQPFIGKGGGPSLEGSGLPGGGVANTYSGQSQVVGGALTGNSIAYANQALPAETIAVFEQLKRGREVAEGTSAPAKFGLAPAPSPETALDKLGARRSSYRGGPPVVMTLVARDAADYQRLRNALETMVNNDAAVVRQQLAMNYDDSRSRALMKVIDENGDSLRRSQQQPKSGMESYAKNASGGTPAKDAKAEAAGPAAGAGMPRPAVPGPVVPGPVVPGPAAPGGVQPNVPMQTADSWIPRQGQRSGEDLTQASRQIGQYAREINNRTQGQLFNQAMPQQVPVSRNSQFDRSLETQQAIIPQAQAKGVAGGVPNAAGELRFNNGAPGGLAGNEQDLRVGVPVLFAGNVDAPYRVRLRPEQVDALAQEFAVASISRGGDGYAVEEQRVKAQLQQKEVAKLDAVGAGKPPAVAAPSAGAASAPSTTRSKRTDVTSPVVPDLGQQATKKLEQDSLRDVTKQQQSLAEAATERKKQDDQLQRETEQRSRAQESGADADGPWVECIITLVGPRGEQPAINAAATMNNQADNAKQGENRELNKQIGQ